MLEVKNLKKIFRKKNEKTKKIVETGIFDVNFQAPRGTIFGLIGPNGAGKTTTMRILANLTSQQSGDILYDGNSYTHIPHLRKKIAFVSGETQNFERLTAKEMIMLFGRMAEVEEDKINERLETISKKLNMADFLDLKIDNFSTGMKQKVSIARALITEPEIIIFDEITNGLDIFAAKNIKEIILDLQTANKVIIFSTHILHDAEKLCEHIGIIHNGRTLISGKLQELKQQHNTDSLEDLFFKLVKTKEDKKE